MLLLFGKKKKNDHALRLLFLIPSLFLVLDHKLCVSADALGCRDGSWCVLPYCECEPLWWFPWVDKSVCQDGFSGTECRCPYEATNIAKRPFWQPIPDSLTGSLAVNTNSDGSILAGTWTSGYEWSSSDMEYKDLRNMNNNDDTENVWSVTKTSSGSYLIGTPVGIQRRGENDDDFQQVFEETGVQGHFAEVDGKIFAGTFEGLFMSVDDGNTWVRTPADSCSLMTRDDYIDTTRPRLDPKPPPNITWCEEQVSYVYAHQGIVFSISTGYAGAHYIDSTVSDPLLESSWTALPTFQSTNETEAPCFGGFCHVHDAIIFHDALYVAFMSNTVYRIPLLNNNNGDPPVFGTWESIFISENVNTFGTTALTSVPDETSIYVSTVDGLYHSRSGDSNTWELIPMDNDSCKRRRTPPLLSLGLVSTEAGDRLIMGTIYGPWLYRIS